MVLFFLATLENTEVSEQEEVQCSRLTRSASRKTSKTSSLLKTRSSPRKAKKSLVSNFTSPKKVIPSEPTPNLASLPSPRCSPRKKTSGDEENVPSCLNEDSKSLSENLSSKLKLHHPNGMC